MMNRWKGTKGMRKKIMSIVLAGAMIVSCCACQREEPDHKVGTSKIPSGSDEVNNDPDDNNEIEYLGAVRLESQEQDGPADSGAGEKNDIETEDTQYDEFVSGSADFAVELFRKCAGRDVKEQKNILISPSSAAFALGMTENGANGITLSEMENVLCGSMDVNTYNEYMRYFREKLMASEKVEFNIANSIWIRDEDNRIQVKDSFLEKNKTYYHADAFLAPFDSTTVSDINAWVNHETNEMIPTLLEGSIDKDTMMYLINAIAFESAWFVPYEETQIQEDEVFINAAGEEETATMLCSTEDCYLQDENAQGFLRYYDGMEYAFMAILPNEGVSVSDYISDMTGGSYIRFYENREYTSVDVKIPEFSYDYGIQMENMLSEMGMASAFDGTADFSNIDGAANLYINRVIHKTHIELDREGTKAAAVTGVEMKNESAMISEKNVYLDRPFIYAIVDMETGLPIFMGVLNTLE